MSFESFESGSPAQEQNAIEKFERKKETSARLRLPVEAFLKTSFKSVEVKGEENLDQLPPDAKVVLATTHISDADVIFPIAKLGKKFNIRAAAPSLHFNTSKEKGDAMPALSLKAVGGEKAAMPLDYKWQDHPDAGRSYYAAGFNPENFTPMKQALEEGDTMLMAAYDPTPVKDGKLPKKGGYGNVYLAEISDAVIVPIAINIKSGDPNAAIRKKGLGGLINRPEAEMIIGKPITPEKITGIEQLGEILKRRKENPKSITKDDLARARELQQALQVESNKVMASLAEMLPEEKRGPWATVGAEGSKEKEVSEEIPV